MRLRAGSGADRPMPTRLAKIAPLLVMTGVALMPRDRAATARPASAGHGQSRPAGDTSAKSGDPATPKEALEPSRGRTADAPQEIPRRGWKDVLIRSWKE